MSFQHYLKLDKKGEFSEANLVMTINTTEVPVVVSRYTVGAETLVNIQTLAEHTITLPIALPQLPVSFAGDISGLTPSIRRRCIIFLRETTGGSDNVRMCSFEVDNPLSSSAIDRTGLLNFPVSGSWVLPVTRISYIV